MKECDSGESPPGGQRDWNQGQLSQARSRVGRRGQKPLAPEPIQEEQGFKNEGAGPSERQT